MADQTPYLAPVFPDAALAENPSQRCPVVLLLDVSASMAGARISELNQGLQAFKDSLGDDPLAKKRVDLALVTFGAKVEVVHEFSTVDAWNPAPLVAEGNTPMGEGIRKALEILQARKDQYRAAGLTPYYRPWVFLITDGEPTDDWLPAAKLVHTGHTANAFLFFAVGVQDANKDILRQICPPGRDPVNLKGLAYRELFLWLSSSMKSVSRSRPEDKVVLENPAAPGGWAMT